MEAFKNLIRSYRQKMTDIALEINKVNTIFIIRIVL